MKGDEMIRKFTKRTEKSVFTDARRILKGMDEGDPHGALVEAVADYLAEDPEGVNKILPTEFVGQTKHKFWLTVTFANVVGPTCAVDGILECLNLLDWRMVCNKFLANVLARMGEDAGKYDWPTPHPEVTHISEDDDTDIHAAVRLMWPVDEKTWRKVSEFNERKMVFEGYQINDAVMAIAHEGAMVQHCLPAHRGEEITAEVFEAHADEIFDEAENRLHAQKAVMYLLMK